MNRESKLPPECGITRSEKHLRTKTELARAIKRALATKRIGQRDAAKLLDLTQPKISALINTKVHGFSLQKLMEILTALGVDVEIVIKKTGSSGRPAKIHITAA